MYVPVEYKPRVVTPPTQSQSRNVFMTNEMPAVANDQSIGLGNKVTKICFILCPHQTAELVLLQSLSVRDQGGAEPQNNGQPHTDEKSVWEIYQLRLEA
jgi:hypothetical protein